MTKYLSLGGSLAWLAMLAALAVSACSATQVSASLTTTYMAAAAGEAAYEALPVCSTTQAAPCQTAAIVSQIKTLDNTAFNALGPIAAAAAGGTSVVTAAETEAATAAVTALTAYLATQGIAVSTTTTTTATTGAAS
jgi:hypothetical protein